MSAWDGAEARFYRAAAAALRDAKAPGQVVEALTLLRSVALVGGAAEEDARRALAAGGSLAEAAASALATRPDAPQSAAAAIVSWTGFEPAGEEMLHAVAASWLPCLASSQRRRLYEEVLDAMPPATAVRVIVPALAPSRTAAGRALDRASRVAVATEAAERLAVALERRHLTRDLILAGGVTAGAGAEKAADVRDACQMLLTAADRLELPPGSHPAAAVLHPSALARAIADQVLTAATTEGVRGSIRGAKKPNEDVVALAAFVLGRLCRRGNADEAADAIIDALSLSLSLSLHPTNDAAAVSSDVYAVDTVGALVAAMPDAHAVERLAGSLLQRLHRSGRSWRAAERCLRACFTARFWVCAYTRHALSDTLLLRRPAPRAVLPALLRLALVSPPEETRAGEVATHRKTAAAALVDTWSDPDLIRGGSAAMQGHVASVTAAALTALPPDTWRDAADATALMRGISARLDSPRASVRRHGKKVATALSKTIDPAKPLTFDDEEEEDGVYASDGDDASEGEAEWEKDAAGLSESETRRAEADAFAAAAVAETDEEASGGGDDDDGDNRGDTSADDADDSDDPGGDGGDTSASEDDSDDPDGPVRLGGGGLPRDESDESDDASSTDDSDASSSDGESLEPYDMSDAETLSDGDPTDPADLSSGVQRTREGGPAAADRRARRAREARKRIAALPRPRSLAACIEALRQSRGGDETAASSSSIHRADAAEGAVHEAVRLIRAAPEELIGCAAALVTALVHAHPPTPDDERLALARRRALAAIVSVVPGVAGPAIAAEAFGSGRCDAGQRLEALDAVADAARELAALPPVASRDDSRRAGEGEGSMGSIGWRGLGGATPGGKGGEGWERGGMVRVGRERRFAPRSLERLRAGGQAAGSPGTARRTRAHLIGRALAGPLLAQAVELVRRAEADAATSAAAEEKRRKMRNDLGGVRTDDEAENEGGTHVPGGGIDAMVLGRLLGTLGECCAAARNAPDAATIAGATLELVASAAVRFHPHPHVRGAGMFAAVGAVGAVSPAAAWHAMFSGGSGGGGATVLGRALARVEDWAEEVHAKDPDEEVRGLALRCSLSSADLQQRALTLGSSGGGEGRDDPMYLLKNITNLAIGEM